MTDPTPPADVEARVHTVLRLLAGDPMDEITMTRARLLVQEAGVAATLAYARDTYQFLVTLPDGREFKAPAPDARLDVLLGLVRA